MTTPWEKQEYLDSVAWAKKSKAGELEVKPCISVWMDVCGFGSALEKCTWDLVELQKCGMLELLSTIYQRAGHPFLVGVEPMPYESILIINDGISRTVDLDKPEYANCVPFVFYLRDLFFAHRTLVELTNSKGYGFRTILAGGERVQYSPTLFTGNSILQHNKDNISPFGKALLKKNFLHNPSEFQMNTAFAKAYSIDSLGSSLGFNINSCYIESSFWGIIEKIPELNIRHNRDSKIIYFNSTPVLEIYFSEAISNHFKGIDLLVQKVCKIRIDERFEGEETIFYI